MKLFDRSVDLAQFDEETPLYPICRAWMRNQPLNREHPKDEPVDSDEDDEDFDEDEMETEVSTRFDLKLHFVL